MRTGNLKNGKLLLLSTCGTSLLTNGAPRELSEWLRDNANKRGLTADDARRLEEHVASRREKLLQANEAEQRRMSAEINGTCAILAEWEPRRVQHYLVHTDTDVGERSADLVREVLVATKQVVVPISRPGLRTDSLANFQSALSDLTQDIIDVVEGHPGWTVVFNLTGGFKSINGYLQALGALCADRCVFLFDNADELMQIPRLPVQWADAMGIRDHLQLFRKIQAGYTVRREEIGRAPDALLLVDADQVSTAFWGDVVWKRVKGTLLAEALHEPLSPKLIVQEAVKKSFQSLPNDRRVHVNEALDDLAAYLDQGVALRKAHSLKKLQTTAQLPSTHELYAWSDADARRLFGHYDGERFVVDTLGDHL